MEVGIKQAKNNLSNLIVQAQTGTRVFLMNRGKRIAEIVPVGQTSTAQQRGLGMFKDKIKLPARWGTQTERERSEKQILDTIEGL